MPKHQIDFHAGSPTSDQWREFLITQFGAKSVDRLEHLGGRLTISLTIPFIPKDRRAKSPTVDDEEVNTIRALSGSKEALNERLNSYDAKNLRLLCERFGIVAAKKVPRVELIAE